VCGFVCWVFVLVGGSLPEGFLPGLSAAAAIHRNTLWWEIVCGWGGVLAVDLVQVVLLLAA
jgi:hypothetical protein